MSITTKLIAWARGRVGQKVGAGECWDLVNSALLAAGAKGSEDFGTIGDDVDYIWGDEVALNAAQAGDIVQTRDHVVTTTIKSPVSSTPTARKRAARTGTFRRLKRRAHHSAIITSLLDKNGTLATLEQNVPIRSGKVVQSVAPQRARRTVGHDEEGRAEGRPIRAPSKEVDGDDHHRDDDHGDRHHQASIRPVANARHHAKQGPAVPQRNGGWAERPRRAPFSATPE